jgi:4-diphosphocytidyl-2-C-methyl-D-erythritol kinase
MLARAKVNLYLHITGRRADGYHLLDSLIVFADTGDQIALAPADKLSLTIDGPLAAGLETGPGNLVLRAALALQEITGTRSGAAIRLTKNLPVASGIGGGSADAAAALRLLAQLNGLSLDDPRIIEVAQLTGADVPVCVNSRGCVMTGVGETLQPLSLPKMPCVMVNPGVPVATKDVFAALGLRNGELLVGVTDVLLQDRWPDEQGSLEEWVEALAASSNDLERPAMRVQPVIGKVIAALNATNGAWLARMSGSGATCFAIYENTAEAGRAAEKLRRDHPGWWVHAGTLS